MTALHARAREALDRFVAAGPADKGAIRFITLEHDDRPVHRKAVPRLHR
jgi:hypothetical protein